MKDNVPPLSLAPLCSSIYHLQSSLSRFLGVAPVFKAVGGAGCPQ